MQSNYDEHGAAIYQLFDATWPGLSRRIELARSLGWAWEQTTTPFLSLEGTQPAAHVGVLQTQIYVEGELLPIAGVHAVCCLPEHRGKGHMRRAMEEALAFIDERQMSALLTCSNPSIYERFGFVRIDEHKVLYERPHAPTGPPAKPIDASDPTQRQALQQALAHRHPISESLAMGDTGWVFGICEIFGQCGLKRVHQLPNDLGYVVYHITDDRLELSDIISNQALSLHTIAQHIPDPYQQIRVHFSADQLPPPQAVLPQDADDVLMVRGPLQTHTFPKLVCLPSTVRW